MVVPSRSTHTPASYTRRAAREVSGELKAVALLQKPGTLEHTVRIGQVLTEELEASPNRSLRWFARRLEGHLSVAELHRAIQVYAVWCDTKRAVGTQLTASHLYVLRNLPTTDQVRLSRAAVTERWSVAETAAAARRPDSGRPRTGRKPAPRAVRQIEQLSLNPLSESDLNQMLALPGERTRHCVEAAAAAARHVQRVCTDLHRVTVVGPTGARLIVVEADPSGRRVLERWLSAAGYSVTACAGRIEALVHATAFDAAVIALRPTNARQRGVALARELRRRQIAPRIVFVTASTADLGWDVARRIGAIADRTDGPASVFQALAEVLADRR